MPQTEDDIPYINRNRLQWSDGDRLGEGSFGIVYRGLQDNAPVAIKVVKRPSSNLVASEDAHHQALAALRQHRREIHRLATVQNAYIIQYLGVFRDSDPHDLYIVTEFLEGGSLHDSLLKLRARSAVLDEHSFLQIALHIAYGLNHVHSEGYSHGDVKPQNVLLTSEFRFHQHDDGAYEAFLPDSAKAKIADFGLSKRLESTASATELSGTLTATGEFGQGPCGTFLYMAPEVYDGVSELPDKQVTAADVYAYALILYELLTGLQSWALERVVNPIQLMSLVKRGQRPAWGARGERINPLYVALVERCWDHNTDNRPTVYEIISTLRDLSDAHRHRLESELHANGGAFPTSTVTRPPSSAPTALSLRRGTEQDPDSSAEEVVAVEDPADEPDDDEDETDDDEADDEDDDEDEDDNDEPGDAASPPPPRRRPNTPSPQRRPRSPVPPRCADELGDDSVLGNDSVLGGDDDDTIKRVISCRLSASAEAALPENLRSNRPALGAPGHAKPGPLRGTAAAAAEDPMADSEDEEASAANGSPRRGEAGRGGDDGGADGSEPVEANAAPGQQASAAPPAAEAESMSDSIPNPDGIDADTLSGTIGNVRLQHVDSTRFPELETPEIQVCEGHLGDVNIPNLPAPRSPAQALDSFLNAGNNYVETGAPQGLGQEAGAAALPAQKGERDPAPPAANAGLKLVVPDPPEVGLDIQAALAGPVVHRSPPEQLVAPPAETSPGASTQPSDASDANPPAPAVQQHAQGNAEDLDDLEEILEGLNGPEPANAAHAPAPAPAPAPSNNAPFVAPPQSVGTMVTAANGVPWHSQMPLNSTAHVQGPAALYSTAHRLQPPQQPPLQQLQPAQALQPPQRPQPPQQTMLQPPLQPPHVSHHQANPNAYFTTSHIGAINVPHRTNAAHPYASPSMRPNNPSVTPPFPSPGSERVPASNTNIPPINLNAGTMVGLPMRQLPLTDLWKYGRYRQVAHELANGRGNYAGDEMLKKTHDFLRSYITVEQQRREWQVLKDLCTAIGNIAQHRDNPIRKDSVQEVVPSLLSTMRTVYGYHNPGPIYAAINYALCNLFKVSNSISDAGLRSTVGIWISHTLSCNLNGGTRGAQAGDEVLGYAATSAIRNFTWMNMANVTALLEVEKKIGRSPITLLLDTVRLFHSRGQAVIVGTGLAAIAPIVHYPRFRMPFIRNGGLKELLHFVNARVAPPRVVHLCFTMLSVVFCGPPPSYDENYDALVLDELQAGGGGGAATLVQSAAHTLRLDQSHLVGGDAGQLDLADTAVRATLQALRLGDRIRAALADARVHELVVSGFDMLRRSCVRAPGPGANDEALRANRARVGRALCELAREVRRDAAAARWLRESGVARMVEEVVVNGMAGDEGFCKEARATVAELNR